MKKKLLFLIPAFVGMSVFSQTQQRVGVKTTNPQATLDINGNMAIERVRANNDGETIKALGWDPTTREVREMSTPDKLFYTLDYRIECTESGGDRSQKNQWVSNFDTKIPYDKFEVIFGRVLPVNRDYNHSNEIDILHSDKDNGGGRKFDRGSIKPVVQILDYPYAEIHNQTDEVYSGGDDNQYYLNPVLRKVLWKDQDTKTWHLSVGYVDARPDNAARHTIYFEWNIQLIAINNSTANTMDIPLRKVSDTGGNGDNTIDMETNPFE